MKTPLRLPRFTFLLHRNDPGSLALAQAISERDPELMIDDLEEPLRLATHCLFWGGFHPSRDLCDPAARREKLPIFRGAEFGRTAGDFLKDLEKSIRSSLSDDALGRIAVQNLLANSDLDLWPRILYRDCHCGLDIDPFIREFGREHILVISLGGLFHSPTGVKTIWLAMQETDKRLEMLEKELEVVFRAELSA